jgi:hypothetical protein
MKRLIATIAVAASLSTAGVLITASPAAAAPPTECPMLHVEETPGSDHVPQGALTRVGESCKSWILRHQ